MNQPSHSFTDIVTAFFVVAVLSAIIGAALLSIWQKVCHILTPRSEQRWYEPSYEQTEPTPDNSIAPFRDDYAELYELVMDEAMQHEAKLLEGHQDRLSE